MNRFFIALVMVLSHLQSNAQQPSVTDRYSIIPYPSRLIPAAGDFVIGRQTRLVLKDASLRTDAEQLIYFVREATGITLPLATVAGSKDIVLIKDREAAGEGYHLKITTGGVTLSAATATGIFWGIETLRQLLPAPGAKAGSASSLPAADITDMPAYSWRGMHLDVARHFFSVHYLEQFIDRMALYKLNKLHLHLTDDQGWRIEIKRYPRLTSEGAWRSLDRNDSACMQLAKENPDFEIDSQHLLKRQGKTLYGGFYTQAQMRSLIAYAAARQVEIIPELDMPGHMKAAISLYPYLSCTGQSGDGQGFSVPLCPCNESTFQFAQNVYSEIMALFPSRYVHIGGDEVEKSTWAQSAACKTLMVRENIGDVKELETYFIRRMEKFFAAHGKKLIGWDEILDGGIDSTATVMYWRSWVTDAPLRAARNGNQIIMAPVNPMYFDAFPDKSSLYNVYHFDPAPAGLSETGKEKIIGAQACLWSERIPSEKRADYMTMPRMTALAEMLWTHNVDDYTNYEQRLSSHYPRWDRMGIHYRLPDLGGFAENNVFTDSAILAVQKPSAQLVVRYTTDGSVPGHQSPELPARLVIRHPATIKLAAFAGNSNRGDISTLVYRQEAYSPPATVNSGLKKGLSCLYYPGSFDSTKKMTTVTPAQTFSVESVVVPPEIHAPSFGLQYRGYVDIPETGVYGFFLTSDDGSLLRIDQKIVVDNDGLHGAKERSGEIALTRGLHVFALDFIEGGGGYTLRLQYARQGGLPRDLPADAFKQAAP